MAKIYTDKDADVSVLKNKTLAVLGFGSPRHAHALNLKEADSRSWDFMRQVHRGGEGARV